MDADEKSMVLSASEFFTKCMGSDNAVAEKLAVEWQEQMVGIPLCHPEEVSEALDFALGN